MADEESGLMASSSSSSKAPRRSDVFLVFCRMLNFVTDVSALLCMIAHGMALVVGPSLFETRVVSLDQALRLYGVLFAVFTVMVETEWQKIMAHVRLFDSWIVRGHFQVFLAVLTLAVAVSDGDDDYHKSLHLYRKISGLCLIGCACVYLLGGMLCFSYIKKARARRVVEFGQLQAALLTLEKQEDEIRKTIARYASM